MVDADPTDEVAARFGVCGVRELRDRKFLGHPWLARWESEMGPVAHRHLADSLGWWREELTSGYSPFTWWWGTEADEQAAWHEVTRWPAGQAHAA